MKKLILVFVFATLMFGSAFAQKSNADFREKVSFGVKAGINISNVYDSQGEQFNADAKLGLAAGIFVALPIGKFIVCSRRFYFLRKVTRAQALYWEAITVTPIQVIILMFHYYLQLSPSR